MVIREMSNEECLQMLARTRLARLACSRADQPYVIPVYLGYDERGQCFYGFTTPGQKIEWMRSNPRVCVEIDEITASDQWSSVVAVGRFEEMPQVIADDRTHLRSPERPHPVGENVPIRTVNYDQDENERERAWQVLQSHPEWWEPGCSVWKCRVDRGSAERYVPVYYRIRIDQITGHEATTDTATGIVDSMNLPRVNKEGWLRRALSALFTGN